MALKSFRDIVHELKMKRDKKLPNLKTPVKGPKGTSRFSRFKSASKSTTSSASLGTKNALSAGTEYPTEESVDEATWPDEMPNEDVDVDEELSISARRKLSRLMKRRKTQLKRSRLRARKRMAKTDVLKKRARRGARADAAKKLAKGKDKKDLSIAMKKSLEKRLAMPAVQRRIKTMTRRMMPTKRKLEISRKRWLQVLKII